jgi:hypothetical protein
MFIIKFRALPSAGLILGQNKHLLRASRGKWGITKIPQQGKLFYQPDIRLKNTPIFFLNIGKLK